MEGQQIKRDEIQVELPRALLGGLRKGPAEELLRSVARDYAQLDLENRRLRRELEELEGRLNEAVSARDEAESARYEAESARGEAVSARYEAESARDEAVFARDEAVSARLQAGPVVDRVVLGSPFASAGLGETPDALTAGGSEPAEPLAEAARSNGASVELPDQSVPAGLDAVGVRAAVPAAEFGRVEGRAEPPSTVEVAREPRAGVQALRQDRDELARSLLDLAQRGAREKREATRRECELMLRKTRAHAERLELELERERASSYAELEELQAFRWELREQMRASLQLLLRTCNGIGPEEGFPFDWGRGLDEPAVVADVITHKSKKKSKS